MKRWIDNRMKRWMDNWMNACIDVRMNGGMNKYYWGNPLKQVTGTAI